MELLREGTTLVNRSGETCNLSTAGVLFTSATDLAVGLPIEYAIAFPTGKPEGVTVHLHCLGKVVRTEQPHKSKIPHPVSIAATLERYEFVRR